MKNLFFAIFICLGLLSSCIIQAPKYASVEQVFALKTDMTQEEVSTALGIPPYSLKSKDDSEVVYIYKYRATERKTMPLFLKKTNGAKATGPYMDLSITFNAKTGKLTSMKSKVTPREEKGKYAIDVNSIFTLLTVTAPALLVYLGLQHTK